MITGGILRCSKNLAMGVHKAGWSYVLWPSHSTLENVCLLLFEGPLVSDRLGNLHINTTNAMWPTMFIFTSIFSSVKWDDIKHSKAVHGFEILVFCCFYDQENPRPYPRACLLFVIM